MCGSLISPHADAIVNLSLGVTAMPPTGIFFFVETLTGNFLMLLISKACLQHSEILPLNIFLLIFVAIVSFSTELLLSKKLYRINLITYCYKYSHYLLRFMWVQSPIKNLGLSITACRVGDLVNIITTSSCSVTGTCTSYEPNALKKDRNSCLDSISLNSCWNVRAQNITSIFYCWTNKENRRTDD